MKSIAIRRVYDAKKEDDTYRILVDRLWPRGIKKTDLYLDEWNKEIAPSAQLRRWFNHESVHFHKFEILYRIELEEKASELNRIREIAKKSNITLLYGAKDPKINHAVVLRNVLIESI
jgi:uncharacterized protein YeaO (DUF488 family)